MYAIIWWKKNAYKDICNNLIKKAYKDVCNNLMNKKKPTKM